MDRITYIILNIIHYSIANYSISHPDNEFKFMFNFISTVTFRHLYGKCNGRHVRV